MNICVCRGGGPYGAGRLKDPKEILAMEKALLQTVSILKKDAQTNLASGSKFVTTASKPVVPVSSSSAVSPNKPASVSVSVIANKPIQSKPNVPVPAVTAVVAKVSTPNVRPPPPPRTAVIPPPPPPPPSLSTTESDIAVAMPIALGLDAFLAKPSQTSIDVSVCLYRNSNCLSVCLSVSQL